MLALDRVFMAEQLGSAGGAGYLHVQVAGDSMEPTLYDGEAIIVDSLVNRIDVDGVYVLRLGADLLVKRAQRRLDGGIVLLSDNAVYQPLPISAAEAAALRVVGRMVWPRVR